MVHIVIHILPQEIDQLEQLLIALKRNSVYLPKNHGIHIEVCMNCNLVDKERSQLSIGFFSQKLFSLRQIVESWASADLRCEIFKVFWGCNDVRRIAVRQTKYPWIMYLDADCIISDHLLINMYNAIQHLGEDSYSIITPQTTRMWDSTWDPITNIYFMEEEDSHAVYDVRDPYKALHVVEGCQIYLKEINTFKFAGWGTTISTKLARLIDIPSSLGSYGLDDTFIMAGCQILKQKGYDVKQFVLQNEVIIENNLFRTNPYQDYLVTIDKRQEFLVQAHANFQPELNKLYERIQERVTENR